MNSADKRVAGCSRAFDTVAERIAAPVICMYTRWVLRRAERLGIRRLYFQARDGYLMYHVARQICGRENLAIQCRYFYTSRYALRLAAYRFHDSSAFDKLFLRAYRQSVSLVLRRAGFTLPQRRAVYEDIGLTDAEAEENLGKRCFGEMCEKLRNSAVFLRILDEISATAYENTAAYIRQEGMAECGKIGIVDLGWTGSMQQTLRALLDSQGIRGRLYGFYMGFLESPPQTASSRFESWLFGARDAAAQAWFSQNVMECLCGAPHGMTLGYEKKDGKVRPVFAPCENDPRAALRLRQICLRTAQNGTFPQTDGNGAATARKLLRGLMFCPTHEQCEALRFYRFCDDVGEQYHGALVEKGTAWDFRKEVLPFKLFFRDETGGFYWYCGSVRQSNLILKPLYRYAYYLTKYIMILRKRR